MRLGRVGEDFEFLQNVLGHRFQSMFYFCSFLQAKGLRGRTRPAAGRYGALAFPGLGRMCGAQMRPACALAYLRS
jgi:hypothetical protein